jgi:hypothetical protein
MHRPVLLPAVYAQCALSRTSYEFLSAPFRQRCACLCGVNGAHESASCTVADGRHAGKLAMKKPMPDGRGWISDDQ